VDWKSNFLGDRVDSYNQAELRKAMERELYFLQYHIYLVALHSYLRIRIPHYDYDTHFGNVHYVFLRGVDPTFGTEYGVYRDRPSATHVEELSSALIGL
jgi:exodeoxyribonuclease V beta subunit